RRGDGAFSGKSFRRLLQGLQQYAAFRPDAFGDAIDQSAPDIELPQADRASAIFPLHCPKRCGRDLLRPHPCQKKTTHVFPEPSFSIHQHSPMNTPAVIEPLEARIAPAAVFTFTDVDGDLVTVKTSKGTNDQLAALITPHLVPAGSLGGKQLQEI